MTAPIPTLRRRNHIVTQHYRLDDLAEWALSKRGRENIASRSWPFLNRRHPRHPALWLIRSTSSGPRCSTPALAVVPFLKPPMPDHKDKAQWLNPQWRKQESASSSETATAVPKHWAMALAARSQQTSTSTTAHPRQWAER